MPFFNVFDPIDRVSRYYRGQELIWRHGPRVLDGEPDENPAEALVAELRLELATLRRELKVPAAPTPTRRERSSAPTHRVLEI